MASYRDAWVAQFAKYEAQYRELLRGDPFRDWEQNTLPEVTAEGLLITGTTIAFARPEEDLASIAWRSCVRVYERAYAEERWLSPLCRDGFPKNRGRCARSCAYAAAFLGDSLDTHLLTKAAADYEEWSSGYATKDWDAQAEANLLSAARMWMILGDVDRASGLLTGRRKFKSHPHEGALLASLVHKGAMVSQFDRYFDEVRAPTFRPVAYMEKEVVRFELAAIRRRFIAGEALSDWSAILAETAA
jgi:hypothetical protein